ncbi:DUF6287 domain-containing protein [Aerococcus sp. JJEM-2022b]|uniref:DUF6287 domain-containing protein n=1 Tax=Aerococcus mictus TaxID=2976810 RepID=UPI00227AE742|nr:DUF6287 domain-containing protein [Aerococcus mictus]MCY3078932.1 DUF6287 domain-containing protein [Aerococcus mictus]
MKKINLPKTTMLARIQQQKRSLLALSVLVSLFVVGCQKDSNQSTATSQSQEAVTSEASSEKADSKEKEGHQDDKAEKPESKTPEQVHQLYQATLDWYQEIVNLAKNHDIQKATIEDPETSYVAFIINDSNGENIQYAFYDINKDGQDELILRDQYTIIAIYTLQGDKPILAKEGGVAGSGGERRLLTLYDNGSFVFNTFHSPSPDAQATNYRITKDGQVEEVKKVAYDLQETKDPAPLLGLENDKKLDIDSLPWQKLAPKASQPSSTAASEPAPSASHQGVDIKQIQAGDLSTLAGTWRNGLGEEMTIGQNGQVSTGEIVQTTTARIEGQILWANLLAGSFGSGLIVAPAGSQIVFHQYTDASDQSRDRLIVTQDMGYIESPERFYYRVD